MGNEAVDIGDISSPDNAVDAGDLTPEDLAEFHKRVLPAQQPPTPTSSNVAPHPYQEGLGHGLDQPGNRQLMSASSFGQFGVIPAIANAGVQASPGLRNPTVFINNNSRDLAPGGAGGAIPETELNPAGRTPADNTGPAYAPSLNPNYGRASNFGGYQANPDPFGVKAKGLKLDAAQQARISDLDRDKELAATRGDIESNAARREATIHKSTHIRADEMQALDDLRREREQQQMSEYTAESAKKNEQISAMKVDPSRIFHNQSDGDRFMFLAAAAIGGAMQGAGWTKNNEFLEQASRLIDRDVAAQKHAIDNKSAGLKQRDTVYGQFLQQYGRADIASAEAKNSMYEAAKVQLQQLAAETNDPLAKQRADEHISQIQQQQDGLKEVIAQKQYDLAQHTQNAWMAGQQAKLRHDQERADKIIAHAIHLREEAAKNGVDMPIEEAQRQAVVDYGGKDTSPGTPMMGYAKKDNGGSEKEREKATTEVQAGLDSLASFDIKKTNAGGPLGTFLAHHGIGTDSTKIDTARRDSYNASVRPLVGAAWRVRTGGVEPKNPHLLDEQAEAFKALPTDSDEVVQEKRQLLQQHLIQSGAAAGVKLGMPSGAVKTGDPAGGDGSATPEKSFWERGTDLLRR